MLHARVELLSTTKAAPMSQHIAGMMVYNTASAADVLPGIYYNDGTQWISVRAGTTTSSTIVENQPGRVGQPGKPGQPGGPAQGVVIVNNDNGSWVYNSITENWTIINENNETLTTLKDNGDGTITYTDESNVKTTIKIADGPAGADGFTPFIAANGNWEIRGVDTGVSAKGTAGKSAYVIWKEIPGNETGTVQDFITSLKGADGVSAAKGETGDKGVDGSVVTINPEGNWEIDGTDTKIPATGQNGRTPTVGANGNWLIGTTDTGVSAKGTAGKSAYDIWKDAPGNEAGTVQDFIASLKGATGNSAYGIWLSNGNVGTEQDFLNALKGADGTDVEFVNNRNGTYTFDNGDGIPIIIDIPATIIDHFDTLIKGGSITVNGNTYTSIEDYLEKFVAFNETLTGLVDNANGTFTYTDEAGKPTVIDVSSLEALTTIALNADSVNIDYKDEKGTITQLNLTKIVEKLETLTDKDEAGKPTVIDVKNLETLTALALNTDGKTLEYKNEAGAVSTINLEAIMQANQKTETIVDGLNTTVTSTIVDNLTEFKVNVATASATTLGVVKESALNPTLRINTEGELSIDLSNMNSVKGVSGTYALAPADAIVFGNAVGGDVIIALPTADATNKGKKYTIKKQDNNEDYYVTVTGNIDGLTELYTALPYSGWDLVSDGTKWKIINKF